MRRTILALMLACGLIASASASAQVSVSIGINVPAYPQLVRVPGYPVYYAPAVGANFFFYDGMYWVYESDTWYASSWYNGPWSLVDPVFVPVFVLRIPVRYYRDPPMYFRAWRPDGPPRWGEHWGHRWEQRRPGWDRWNRAAVPAPAPLPVYQRQYTGNRYPPVAQQRALQSQNYRYQPHDAAVRQHFQQTAAPPRSPANELPSRQAAPRGEMPAVPNHPVPPPPSRAHENAQRPAMPAERGPQGHAAAPERAPQHPVPARPEPSAGRPVPAGPMPAPQERPGRGQGQGHGQEKEHERGEGRGQDKKN